jgi:predicted nucleic acid-binding protein
VDSAHQHYQKAQDWFISSRDFHWGLCPLTEAGFLRVTTNPAYGTKPRTFAEAIAILQVLKGQAHYWYCAIDKTWVELTAPFAARINGHQQVTDAYLLGLAIKEELVLVTFDRGIQYLAGADFRRHVLVLD